MSILFIFVIYKSNSRFVTNTIRETNLDSNFAKRSRFGSLGTVLGGYHDSSMLLQELLFVELECVPFKCFLQQGFGMREAPL